MGRLLVLRNFGSNSRAGTDGEMFRGFVDNLGKEHLRRKGDLSTPVFRIPPLPPRERRNRSAYLHTSSTTAPAVPSQFREKRL